MQELGFDEDGRGYDNGSGRGGSGRRGRNSGTTEEEAGATVLEDFVRTSQRPAKTATVAQIQRDLSLALSAISLLPAIFLGDHWVKSPSETDPLAEPLAQYIKTLKPADQRKITKYALPIAIGAGALQVFGEPIAIEVAKFRQKAQVNYQVPNPIQPATTPEPESSFQGTNHLRTVGED